MNKINWILIYKINLANNKIIMDKLKKIKQKLKMK